MWMIHYTGSPLDFRGLLEVGHGNPTNDAQQFALDATTGNPGPNGKPETQRHLGLMCQRRKGTGSVFRIYI